MVDAEMDWYHLPAQAPAYTVWTVSTDDEEAFIVCVCCHPGAAHVVLPCRPQGSGSQLLYPNGWWESPYAKAYCKVQWTGECRGDMAMALSDWVAVVELPFWHSLIQWIAKVTRTA